MKYLATLPTLVLAGSLLLGILPFELQAQDLSTRLAKADRMAKAGNWAEAYLLYKELTEKHSEGGIQEPFGNAASYLWYRRGQSAQRMAILITQKSDKDAKQKAERFYEDAINSFDQCNAIGVDSTKNVYKNKAVFLKGQCQMASLKYEKALQSWSKFHSVYNDENPWEKRILEGQGKGKWMLDRAICFLKKAEPDLKQGRAALNWVMQNASEAPDSIPSVALTETFLAFCQAIKNEAEKAKDDREHKKALETELVKFMEENRGMIVLPPYQMYAYTTPFLKLAIEMQKLGMHKAAFMLQSILPNTTVSKEDMELKLKNLGGQKGMVDHFDIITTKAVKKDLEDLNKRVSKGEPHEMTQNLIMAAVYEKEGNSRAAFGIYEMIELYHNDHPKREEWLYHCVRTSYNIGEIFKTKEYGERFLKLFPKSSRSSDVEKYMLTSLFQNGKYKECVEIVNRLLPSLKEGAKRHDIALYCLGGSHYYLGEPYKASDPLDKHVKLYGKGGKHKESQYSMSTQYWDASNETYLLEWAKGAKKLDKFLNDYPKPDENPYFPLAKYDRANCHTNLEEDELSIGHLDVVISHHKDSPIIDRAYALRGNNHQNLSKVEEAYKDYKAALELSRKMKNEWVEAEVLNYLVLLLGDDAQPSNTQPEKVAKTANFKKAVQYYDEFWKKYSEGDYKALVAVSGMPALRSVNRGAEGLQNLKQVIVQLANIPRALGMDKLINTYTEEYLIQNNNKVEKLEKHYAELLNGLPQRNLQRTRIFATMSLLDIYYRLVEEAKEANDDAGEKKWKQAINRQLKELDKFIFDVPHDFILFMVANKLRIYAAKNLQEEDAVTLRTATRFYEQVIQNADDHHLYKNEAIFRLALVSEMTEDVDKMRKAYVYLKALRDAEPPNTPDERTKEKAHFHMLRLAYKMGNHKVAIAEGTAFLKLYQASRNRTAVRITLGDAHFALKNNKEALGHYERVLLSATGILKHSGPTLLKVMDILQENDKYKAYSAGFSYVRICKVSFDRAFKENKMSEEEKEIWIKIKKRVKDLEKDPEVIKGMEKAEAEDAARPGKNGKC